MTDFLYYLGCFFILKKGTEVDWQLFRKLDEVYSRYRKGDLKDKVKIINQMVIIDLDRSYGD